MLNSLVIRQMHSLVNREIKTTMRYCFTLTRMAIIKKKKKEITNVGKDAEILKPPVCILWECKMVQPL